MTMIFSVLSPCRLVGRCQRFWKTHFLHLHRKAGICRRVHKTPKPRRTSSYRTFLRVASILSFFVRIKIQNASEKVKSPAELRWQQHGLYRPSQRLPIPASSSWEPTRPTPTFIRNKRLLSCPQARAIICSAGISVASATFLRQIRPPPSPSVTVSSIMLGVITNHFTGVEFCQAQHFRYLWKSCACVLQEGVQICLHEVIQCRPGLFSASCQKAVTTNKKL
jgi:hypothetical protein